jgi:hypothetical protein
LKFDCSFCVFKRTLVSDNCFANKFLHLQRISRGQGTAFYGKQADSLSVFFFFSGRCKSCAVSRGSSSLMCRQGAYPRYGEWYFSAGSDIWTLDWGGIHSNTFQKAKPRSFRNRSVHHVSAKRSMYKSLNVYRQWNPSFQDIFVHAGNCIQPSAVSTPAHLVRVAVVAGSRRSSIWISWNAEHRKNVLWSRSAVHI